MRFGIYFTFDHAFFQASLRLYARFGWSWRRKACPPDALLTLSSALALPCHQTSISTPTYFGTEPMVSLRPSSAGSGPSRSSGIRSGLRPSLPNTASPAQCSFGVQPRQPVSICFRPTELISAARSLATGPSNSAWPHAVSPGRLTSGQLELRIMALERRRTKQTNRANGAPQLASSTTGIGGRRQSVTATVGQGQAGQGLSAAAYPVYYATAPLPLFLASSSSGTFDCIKFFNAQISLMLSILFDNIGLKKIKICASTLNLIQTSITTTFMG
ncbi:unnamed protein product [Protopolystoma xenopodis]|uniref:Uncharacterized protein n=1 Tax=Protopolystoma xenopodis TaxID=117903 RepID=A0A448X4H1_9PLAT|nr:unnamed protein product [Protopolystoma xenopodis]